MDTLVVAGTKGSIHMSPAYGFGEPLHTVQTHGEEKTAHSFKATDQFGGELAYFSDCILQDRDPEPDGEEGLADLRVVDGVFEALETGRAVALAPFVRHRRIDPKAQLQALPPVRAPDPVDASSPTRD